MTRPTSARLLGLLLLIFAGADARVMAQSTEELLANLKSPIAKTRREAANHLGDRRLESASGALQEVLRSDTQPEVRSAAIRALGRIRDMGALPVMLGGLKDTDVEVRRETILALVTLYVEKDVDFILARRSGINLVNPFLSTYEGTVVDGTVTVDPRIPEGLMGLVGGEPEEVSIPAIRALGVLRATSVVESLGRKLASTPGLRVEILRTLMKIGDPGGGQFLTRYFNDQDAKVRHEAITAAGVLKAKEAVPALLSNYRSSAEENTRRLALEALARIADPSAKEAMMEALSSTSAELRRFANEGLGRIKAVDQIEIISGNRLKEKDTSVRLAQGFALYRLGRKEYIEAIAAELASGRKEQAGQYLLEAQPEDLYPLLDTGASERRRRVVEALGKIGSLDAIPPLRRLLRSGDPELVNAANLAIFRIERRTAAHKDGTPQDAERQRRPKKVVP